MAFRQTAFAIKDVGDNIARIGDVNNEAVEAAGHNLVDITFNLCCGKGKLVQTVTAGNQVDIADAVYNSIAVAQVSVGTAVDFYIMRAIQNCVAQVLYLGSQLGFFRIYQHQLGSNALNSQAVCNVSTNVT